MDRTELNRREFQRLGAAALGGMMLEPRWPDVGRARADENPLLSDPHVCRGINTCKGKGASGKNDLRRPRHLRHRRETHLPRRQPVQGPRGLRCASRRERLQRPGRLQRAVKAGHLGQSSEAFEAIDDGRKEAVRQGCPKASRSKNSWRLNRSFCFVPL